METITEKLLSETAKNFAVKMHRATNHKYDGKLDYSHHLQMVVDFAKKYKDMFSEEKHDLIFACCWAHDVIEDTRQTYNDVSSALGLTVAECTYALTNEKGKTRFDRASIKYYQGICEIPLFTFVKICDRLANVYYGKQNKSRMLEVYRKEQEHFKAMLYKEQFKPMFDELEELLKP